jgi:membrane carboxypeptidase/penicillin-binding protein
VNIFLANTKINKQDLSDEQLDIFLKVQDPNFYNHRGVEFRTPGSGWTTITQSLAKKFYFKNFKQGIPKIKQTLCARFALHPFVSKDTQITLFLNIMYFGNNQYGIVDAANYYYSKKVYELNKDEFISLIASLIAPVKLNVEYNPEGNYKRVERIKKLLTGEYKPKGLLDIMYDKTSG